VVEEKPTGFRAGIEVEGLVIELELPVISCSRSGRPGMLFTSSLNLEDRVGEGGGGGGAAMVSEGRLVDIPVLPLLVPAPPEPHDVEPEAAGRPSVLPLRVELLVIELLDGVGVPIEVLWLPVSFAPARALPVLLGVLHPWVGVVLLLTPERR